MIARINFSLAWLAVGLLLLGGVGAAEDIRQFTDPQGTIHIDNRTPRSPAKDMAGNLAPAAAGVNSPQQMLQPVPSRRGRIRLERPDGVGSPLPRRPAPAVQANGQKTGS